MKTLIFICLFTSVAGVLYQIINEKFLNWGSVLVGLPLGLAFGIMELFLFPKVEVRLREWSFTKMFVFKTLLYTATIYTITVVLTIIGGYFEGRELSELPPYLLSLDRLVLVAYTLVIYSLLVFFLQINHLMGEGVLWKFISGKYRRPREEKESLCSLI